jgi:UDP-sulfoquinovose synthase
MEKMKTIFVLGGDGFCGWPIALRFSKQGHHIVIIDNLSHRKIDVSQGSMSLTPIKSLQKRIDTWEEMTGKTIIWEDIDLATDYDAWCSLLKKYKPTQVIHLAEQRSAPYSMRSSKTSRYTVNNNLNATHNVLAGIVQENMTQSHLIHIGTMGVYGYGAVPDTVIPEGYIDVQLQGKNVEILHPAYPGSIYHMTKTQDALFFQFYAKNYNLQITDLHQGIIWGSQTEETKLHPNLMNRLDYDEAYGTVLNRFLIQATKNIPLSVYGTGGQTRAFIHLQNSGDCIELAINNPPKSGDRVQIFNQMTETLNVKDLAERIVKIHGGSIEYISNPRKELKENELHVSNKQFLDLGLVPITLDDEHISDLIEEIKTHIDRCGSMTPISFWTNLQSNN